MQTIHGFLNNTVSDMKGGRESWRIFALFGVVSLTVASLVPFLTPIINVVAH